MQITFNTGRLYTREGQIITARYDEEEGKTYFTDHSRMIHNQVIEGPMNLPDVEPGYQPRFLATFVMEAYDNSRFTYAPWEKKVVQDETAEVHKFRL